MNVNALQKWNVYEKPIRSKIKNLIAVIIIH